MIHKFKSLWIGKPIWAKAGLILTFIMVNYLFRAPTLLLWQKLNDALNTLPNLPVIKAVGVFLGATLLGWIAILNGYVVDWLLRISSAARKEKQPDNPFISWVKLVAYCTVLITVTVIIRPYTLILQENIVLLIFLIGPLPRIINGVRTDIKENNSFLVCIKWILESMVFIAFLIFVTNPALNILTGKLPDLLFNADEHPIISLLRVALYIAVAVALARYDSSPIRSGWWFGWLVLSLLLYGVLQGWIYRTDIYNWLIIVVLVGLAALWAGLFRSFPITREGSGLIIGRRITRISMKSKHQISGSVLMGIDTLAHLLVLTAFYFALLPRAKYRAHFNSLYHEWIRLPLEWNLEWEPIIAFIVISAAFLIGIMAFEDEKDLHFGESYKLRLPEKWGADFWPRSLRAGDLLEVIEAKNWKGQTVKEGGVIHLLLWNGHILKEIPLNKDGLVIGKNSDEKKIPRFARIVSIDDEESELMFEFIDEKATPDRWKEHMEQAERALYDEYKTAKQDGAIERALLILSKGISEFPKSQYFWRERGGILLSQGAYKESADAYLKALELDPQDQNSRYNLGQIYLQQYRTFRRQNQDREANRILHQFLDVLEALENAKLEANSRLFDKQPFSNWRETKFSLRLDLQQMREPQWAHIDIVKNVFRAYRNLIH